MTAATKSFTGRKRIRKTFGRIPEITRMPNLIEVQKRSYDHFLQFGVVAEKREDVGLQEVFKSVFPIKDFSERSELQFVRYELEDPKYDVEECQQRGMTFAAPLKVTLRLVVWDVTKEPGSRSIRDIKEQDIFFADVPVMADVYQDKGQYKLGSLGTFFRGLVGPGAFYNEITIRQGELHLERSLTGDWNIDEFIARVPARFKHSISFSCKNT
jgi:DNA-directed RNA polymerase beta subunit